MKIIIILLIIFLTFTSVGYSINTFIAQETEKISLAPNVTDADADKIDITYTPPLNEKGEWQTKYGDAGEYHAEITASDGITNDSREVLIIVKKKEEPPSIDSFTPPEDFLNIKETDSVYFNISASDLNKDNLVYEWFVDDKKIKESMEFFYNTSYKDGGMHKIRAEVSDGTNATIKEWKVDVADVDRHPVFDKIENKIVNENEELTISLNAVDPDGDEINYSAESLPEGARLEGNVFAWKPGFDTVKKETFFQKILGKFMTPGRKFNIGFIASSKGRRTVQKISITVNDVNRAPVLEDIEPITINEGGSFKIAPKAYDLDGDRVSISYSRLANKGVFNKGAFKSSFGDAGTYYVKVAASDGALETSKLVQVNINKSNRAPALEKIKDIKAREGDDIVVLLNAHDPDGDKINYSVDNPPKDSVMKDNAFLWTPDFNLTGKRETKKFNLVFGASDGKLEAKQIVKLEVSDKNRAPKIINATKSVSAKVNKPVLMFVKAIDEDGDDLTYTWDFGFFDKYKVTPVHQRIFTSRGAKVVKVIVSDGADEAEQVINVNVG